MIAWRIPDARPASDQKINFKFFFVIAAHWILISIFLCLRLHFPSIFIIDYDLLPRELNIVTRTDDEMGDENADNCNFH